MARTKASVGAKVSSGKSSKARCSVAPAAASSAGSSAGSTSSRGGGNSVCPRDTPNWQKPITSFFGNKGPGQQHQQTAGDGDISEHDSPQKAPSKLRRANIESDSDSESPQPREESPRNQELEDSILLEPLTGESSRKINEFYTKNGTKGKGVGKKTNKENIDTNSRRSSGKRDLELEEISSEEEARPQASKRVKVN